MKEKRHIPELGHVKGKMGCDSEIPGRAGIAACRIFSFKNSRAMEIQIASLAFHSWKQLSAKSITLQLSPSFLFAS
jgi:hypothetical protein